MSELTPERAEELLGLVEPDDAKDLRRLLTYDEKSAGGIMTTEPVILSYDATVAEALARIRHPGCPPRWLPRCMSHDRPWRPHGPFPRRRSLPASSAGTTGDSCLLLVDTDLESVDPEAPLDEVVRHFARYNLVGLPVVDSNDHLLGVVTVDDVVDNMLPEDWRESHPAASDTELISSRKAGDSDGN